MKKNLRNILVLAMGLMTTVSFAQDWNVDSRTRIDMSGDNDKMETYQRATVGATWGGSDWGIHVSSDVNYRLGGEAVSMGIYEAYASADLMGYASVTAGRQAINNGSGALMSTNDWGGTRNTWDGMSFGLSFTDMADISLGYHSNNGGGLDEESEGNMWLNAGGEFSGWNVNVLYMTEEGTDASDDAATGIDISGEVMGAGIDVSMNSDFSGNTMRVIGLSYSVNDIGLNVGQTVYDGAFGMANGNMGAAGTNSWASHGNMGHLGAGDEMLSYGLSYEMAGIAMSATMRNATNPDNDDTRDVMEISLGYSLGDNAGLSLMYATDDNTTAGIDGENTYMYLTLTVTP